MAIGRGRQFIHVVPRRQDIRIVHAALRLVGGVRLHQKLHRRQRAQGGLRAPAGEVEIPALGRVEHHLHGCWPIHDLHLRVDPDRLQLLLHYQRRVVHGRVIFVGQQDHRLSGVAGLGQKFLRRFRVMLVVGFLAGVGVRGLVGILETDVQLVIAVGRGIHDLIHVQRGLDRLAHQHVVGRRGGGVGVGDLNPPVVQRQHADGRVLFQVRQRFGRQVLDPLQLAGFQAGDAGAGFGHDTERDGVETGLLVAAEAGTVFEGRVRLVAVEAL